MNTGPSAPDTSRPSLTCMDCGASIGETVGGIAICSDCFAVRGSCCFEACDGGLAEGSEPREYSSPACFAHVFEEENTVQHNKGANMFSTQSGAQLDYRIHHGEELEITHTVVPQRLRGQGLASALMKAAIAYAETNKLTLRASCSYANAYLNRRAHHADPS